MDKYRRIYSTLIEYVNTILLRPLNLHRKMLESNVPICHESDRNKELVQNVCTKRLFVGLSQITTTNLAIKEIVNKSLKARRSISLDTMPLGRTEGAGWMVTDVRLS